MIVALAVAQIAILACAFMPGVTEPARGALLLMSLWCFGASVGARVAGRWKGGEG